MTPSLTPGRKDTIQVVDQRHARIGLALVRVKRASVAPASRHFSVIIARMKFSNGGDLILLAAFVVGVACMGQGGRAQSAAPPQDEEEVVKQGQEHNRECKQEEPLKRYTQVL